ncbi:hypothetical protein BH10CYA1_BH10CYA1_59780 [soil metagenome]
MSTAIPNRDLEPPVETEIETETVKIARLETATETMMAYAGYLNTQIFIEEKTSSPNQAKIQALREEKEAVLLERRTMRPENEKLIARAIYVYAPIMKALHANDVQA